MNSGTAQRRGNDIYKERADYQTLEAGTKARDTLNVMRTDGLHCPGLLTEIEPLGRHNSHVVGDPACLSDCGAQKIGTPSSRRAGCVICVPSHMEIGAGEEDRK
jgi:hypothetical protein